MKIRCLADTNFLWNAKAGPGIGNSNDLYFLQDEPWLEIKNTSIQECKRDGVIPWSRGQGGVLFEAAREQYPMILGPNVVFGCADAPERNLYELENEYVYRLLMLSKPMTDLAKQFALHPERVKMVRHFMRPELYKEPFEFEHQWDIFFHIKGDINPLLRVVYENFTATSHGWYTFNELKYKARHSKVCVHSCAYETYGIAIHEISLLGCPIVYDELGLKEGTFDERLGVKVSSVRNAPIEELQEAVKKAMSMDRHEIWKASLDYQDPERIKQEYREALCVS